MNKKYLIALDMDGTLLNSERKISNETVNYLKKLQQEGHKIVISSGRPYRAIKPYYELLGLKTPIICYNGTYIHNFVSKFNKRELLPSKIIREIILKIGEENFENIFCENDTDIYTLKEDGLLDFFWKDGMILHIGSMKNIQTDMYIMIIVMKNHDFDEQLVKLGFSHDGIGLRFWSGTGLTSELYFLNHNKGEALKKICQEYNFSMKDIIAFGDAENDIPMFDMVGTSVGMKNSHEDLSKHIDMVSVEDNDNDGVMKTLMKLLNESGNI